MTITETSITVIHQLSLQIPEFKHPYHLEVYQQRVASKKYLALAAIHNKTWMGFKLGYALDNETFYSWMGGVLLNFRRQGVAQALATYQEEWLIKNGYKTLKMKTRNTHKAMLIFAIKNGFFITGVKSKEKIKDYRIFLEKNLL